MHASKLDQHLYQSAGTAAVVRALRTSSGSSSSRFVYSMYSGSVSSGPWPPKLLAESSEFPKSRNPDIAACPRPCEVAAATCAREGQAVVSACGEHLGLCRRMWPGRVAKAAISRHRAHASPIASLLMSTATAVSCTLGS
eukprot:scaffold624_cov402-Prasinococcus_capsulatus_cf.AAC.52